MKNKKILYMLFTVMILSNFIMFNSVKADEVQAYGFIDFEEATVDSGDYTESIATFDKQAGVFQADDSPAIDTRSWKWQVYNDFDNNHNYCNLSQGVTFVSFWLRPDMDSPTSNPYVLMKNSDGDTIVEIKLSNTGAQESRWSNVDHENNEQILDTWINDEWNYFSVAINSSDELYFQVKDSDDNWHYHTDTPSEIKDNYNITQIDFWSRTGGSTSYFYFDNMTLGQYLPTGTYFDDSDLVSICSNPIGGFLNIDGHKYIEHRTESPISSTIYSVLLPIGTEQYAIVSNDPTDYTLRMNSFNVGTASYIQEYGSGYAVIWDNINGGAGKSFNDEQIVFAVGCDESVSWGSYTYYWYSIAVTGSGLGATRTHNSGTLYADGILSGSTGEIGSMDLSICWYYDTGSISQPEPIPSLTIIEQYVDSYAENGTMGWLEFYQWFTDCYHRVGDNPYMIYNLTGNNTGGINTYRVNLVKTSEPTTFVYTTLVSVSGDYKTAYFRVPDYVFVEKGQYYWQVYNTSDYGLTQNDLVYTSRTIYVCDPVTTGGDQTELLPTLQQPLGSIVGFIIVGFSILMPFIIAGSIGKTIGSNIQVPPLVYGFFGALGISVSIIMELFPTWIVFFIIAVGVIIVALTYLLNLRQQGVV